MDLGSSQLIYREWRNRFQIDATKMPHLSRDLLGALLEFSTHCTELLHFSLDWIDA